MTVTVLLVDDDALVRSGLRTILSADRGIDVIGEAGDGQAAIKQARLLTPDVVLMDLQMPIMDGVAATAALTAFPKPPAVLVLTTFHLDHYVLGALRAGASGFLLKDTAPVDIARAVHTVAAGDTLLSAAVTQLVVARFSEIDGGTGRTNAKRHLMRLTEREREVAVEVGNGKQNSDIAAGLHMSEATVKVHVSRILAKTLTTNRVQIAILVQAAGWLQDQQVT